MRVKMPVVQNAAIYMKCLVCKFDDIFVFFHCALFFKNVSIECDYECRFVELCAKADLL